MSIQDVQGKSRVPMFHEPEVCGNQEVHGTSFISSNAHAGYSMKVPGSRRFMNHVQDFAGIRRFRFDSGVLHEEVQEVQCPGSERFPGTEGIRIH
jgi:hypothetical protein